MEWSAPMSGSLRKCRKSAPRSASWFLPRTAHCLVQPLTDGRWSSAAGENVHQCTHRRASKAVFSCKPVPLGQRHRPRLGVNPTVDLSANRGNSDRRAALTKEGKWLAQNRAYSTAPSLGSCAKVAEALQSGCGQALGGSPRKKPYQQATTRPVRTHPP
jgi:hypothetical protein